MLRINFHGRRRFWARIYALRGSVRASEISLTCVGVAVGVCGGLTVALMSGIGQVLHAWLFHIPLTARLSGSTGIAPMLLLVVPVLGGMMLGLVVWASGRVRTWQMMDAIEANALHGGKMSFKDSMMLAVQTLISNGFGASVGLEAGYTQVSASIASKLGEFLHLRRSDMRILVGCGAAASIAAAFDAPLTGAFYAFELIIGTYTIGSVAPVMGAALAASIVIRTMRDPAMPMVLHSAATVNNGDYIAFIVLGLVCGGIGIALMRGVTLVEKLFRMTKIPSYLRPAIGGLAIGGLALVTPQILSGGHGALHLNMEMDVPIKMLVMLFCLKALASAISIGSGFRGGLFFAALFLGALLGKFLAALCTLLLPQLAPDPTTVAVLGMSALTVAVVGGPLTMAFLALETTGDYVITGLALTAAIISSLTVREFFGYSFSTWRLHLRGESIRSALDVGWMRSLTVGKLMQAKPILVKSEMLIAEFRKQYPLGSAGSVIAVDEKERYAGWLWVSDAYVERADDLKVLDVVRQPEVYLLRNLNVKQAIEMFDKNSCEVLAVAENSERKVVGLLTEAHALKRYAEELDKAHRSLAGSM